MVTGKRLSLFSILNYAFLSGICIIMFYPLWYTVATSFMKESEFLSKIFVLYPSEPTFSSYKTIFEDGKIFTNLKVTVFITVVGTLVSLVFTALSAYGLSKKFFGTTFITYLAVFTMFLRPGLIPEYHNLKSLGLINNIAVYIIPFMINTFYLIILRTYFQDFPKELEESARIDGCMELGIFFRIILPLSKPILAAIGLFFAVQFWNTYMQSVFFISDPDKKTVQEYLKKLVSDSTDMESLMMAAESEDKDFSAETIRMANVVIVLVPILAVYPFLQKYFVKGLLIGAVKG
jgi:putative aldouronate transport system permease protein